MKVLITTDFTRLSYTDTQISKIITFHCQQHLTKILISHLFDVIKTMMWTTTCGTWALIYTVLTTETQIGWLGATTQRITVGWDLPCIDAIQMSTSLKMVEELKNNVLLVKNKINFLLQTFWHSTYTSKRPI